MCVNIGVLLFFAIIRNIVESLSLFEKYKDVCQYRDSVFFFLSLLGIL